MDGVSFDAMNAPRHAMFAFLVIVSALLMASYSSAEDGGEVQIGKGRVGSSSWSLEVYRGDGRHGGTSPCIVTTLKPPPPGFVSRLTICGSLKGSQILNANSAGVGVDEETVLGFAFSPDVVSVRLWLAGRRSRIINLSMLGRNQARRASVDPLRYGVATFVGNYCLERFAAYDAAGRVTRASSKFGCPAHAKGATASIAAYRD
jgi:hypothetical protein